MMHSSFALVLLLFSGCCSSAQKNNLHFSYITTITGGIRAIGGKPVIDLALEEINNRNDILQNYTLNYTVIRNSECSRTAALNSFFADFPYTNSPSQQTTTFLALLCCGCSPATIPVAEISHYWNIPQIAFAVADNELTDRSRFKSLFRTLPSFELLGMSLAELVHQFRWRQMAIVSQDETLFTGVNVLLRDIFQRENWILDESALIQTNGTYFTNEGNFPFDTAFSWMKRDFRVIYINTYAEYAYLILCKAHELGLLAPEYVWITPMFYNKEWWKPISKTLSFACTESELLEVLIGSIGVVPDGYFVTENENAMTFSGQMPTMFNEEYKRRLSLPKYNDLEELGIAGVAYDTIWSIALGLDEASNRIADNDDSGCEELLGELVPLEEFDYTNQKMGCILERSMRKTEFNGITGQISYNSFGSRPNNVYLVQQYRIFDNNSNVERQTVAKILLGNSENHFMFRKNEEETTLWKTGVPYDGSIVEIIHEHSVIMSGIYYSLGIIGLVFLLICLLVNIIFRKKKVVKLSSPNLNYFIITGAALLYVSIYLYIIPINTKCTANIICNFRLWTFSIGYTLCFATILSKTWRIYYIFNNPTTKKKLIKDWLLVVIIVVTVAIDIIILLIGTAIPNSQLQGTRIQDKEQFNHVSVDGINQEYYVYVCSTGNSVIWLGISFAYKGLLQIVGIFMAFHIRRVKIKALNDSKETGAIIYINSIILVLMIVAVFVLEGYHNVHAALFGLALFVQATLFLGLLFIPKVISLYKDPSGAKIFNSTTLNRIPSDKFDKKENHQNGVVDANNGINSCEHAQLQALKDRVRTLEDQLRNETVKAV